MIPLKTTLFINASSSGLTGIGLMVFSGTVATIFGMPTTTPFTAAGIFLVLFASYVFYIANRSIIPGNGVRTIIWMDCLWILGSVLVIAFLSHTISLIGIAAIAAVAVWVLTMVVLQVKGLSAISLLLVLLIMGTASAQQTTVGLKQIASDTPEHIATAFLDAVRDKSHPKAAPLIDSLIEWHQPGLNRFSGTHSGAAQVFHMFKELMEMSAQTLQLTDAKVIGVTGNSVVCKLHWNAVQPTGKILDVDNIDVYTIEHGKIVKAVVYSTDIKQENNFWQ